ncbi:transcriptional regulator, partial [Lactiplantibacillus plantarum]
MKRTTIRKVEDILRDYPKIDKYIEKREQELRYPTVPRDDNVGGGKALMRRSSSIVIIVLSVVSGYL